MTDALVDLGWLAEASASPSDHDQQRNKPVALAALKFTADNIDVAKEITTEGISEDERQQYIRKISEATSAEIFEFSTCNRVLYVGFDIQAEELSSTVSRLNNTASIPFELYEDTEAWRQLVKICSGLDSFMMGELQVMSQFRKSINFHKEHQLVGHFNSAFFEHVISQPLGSQGPRLYAHHGIDVEFGYIGPSGLVGRARAVSGRAGFGDMGMKAVEAPLEANQTTVAGVSRDLKRSASNSHWHQPTMLSYEQWNDGEHEADLVISTIRNATPTYNADHQLPLSSAATVMDFSWPPSVDVWCGRQPAARDGPLDQGRSKRRTGMGLRRHHRQERVDD